MDADNMVYDFTPDEFDNQDQFKEKRKVEAEYKKMMEDCIRLLGDELHAEPSSHRNLKSFLIHESSTYPFIIESFQGIWKNKEFYCCILEYSGEHVNRNIYHSGDPKYFAGLITTTKKYPHTIVQPETIAHKVEDLFTKTDVDFNHAKKFSRKFHVITKDKTALEMLWHSKDLDKLAGFHVAEFELHDHACYFRAGQKPITLNETAMFIDLARTLMEIL
jgi:hypothetical protein